MKKILGIIIWTLAVILIIAGLFFTRKYHAEKPCTAVNININYEQEGYKTDVFLTYEDVRKFIHHRFDSLLGRPMGSIDIEELETKTKEIPYVLKADAFKSINGEVTLNIKQRRAIVLIMDLDGTKYYIDEVGGIIPARPGYPADVLVCNGNIPAYKFYGKNNNPIYKDSIMSHSILGDIYILAKIIDKDAFLRKEIVQLYITRDNEFEMVPLVGRHKIIFGTVENSNAKFEKLTVFYHQAKNFNAWGKYKSINLKYKEQIVCTKK
ncbi:MAG: hypothetical protein DRI84_08120 [Bacteroidetes bacterium]|nr:MAG: hypothetical protein DRI84_08120 [Bacteroidota bacterium]